jgi:hypothetical protein
MMLIFSLSALFTLAGPVWAWFTLRGIREPLILHISTYTGINQIGRVKELLALGATGLVLVLTNGLLAFALDPREPALSKLVALITLFLALLLFIGFMATISVNS